MTVAVSDRPEPPATWRDRLDRAPVSSSITLVAGFMVLLLLQGSAYHQDLFMLGINYSMLALGLYVPFVLAGALSFAYSCYLAIGGYSIGLIAVHTGLPLVVGMLVGAAISAAVALVLGLATSRLSSFYLAAVTLLFSEAFATWLLDASSITKGSAGIGGIRDLTVFGHRLTNRHYMVAALLLVWLVAVMINRMRRGLFGIALRARSEIPLAVEASGVRIVTLTLIALCSGAAISSVGGALFVSYNGYVGPDTFTLHIVILAVFMPLLGGRKSAWGAVLGAILVVYFSFNFRWFANTGTLAFAVAVLLVLLIAPNGILGAGDRLLRPLRSARGRASGGDGDDDGE